MRIALVVATGEFAGTERYVADVGGVLARRGHDVVVVGGEPGAMGRVLDPAIDWRAGTGPRQAGRALAGAGRFDVVHSHNTKADFVAAAAAARTAGRRVSTRHITAPRGFTRPARLAGRAVRRALALEIAVSRWTSDQLDHPADVVLLNGVHPAPAPAGPREPVVVVAQRLHPEKDTATAVRAFARSGLAGRGWRLVLAGAGPESAALADLARAEGVAAAVDLPGWVADPYPLFASASALLAPAPGEPCGLTVIEAMARALPVVAAAAGGHLETVGPVPGAALFAPGDADAAAAALVAVAADPAAAAGYGAALRDRQLAHLDVAGHVDRLEALYRDVVAGRRAR